MEICKYPIGSSEDSDGAGVGDCGDELRAGDVGSQGPLNDAVVESKNPSPTHFVTNREGTDSSSALSRRLIKRSSDRT